MGSGEGGQGPAGDSEVRQGRAGGGTTYTWGIKMGESGGMGTRKSDHVCDLEECRHFPTPSLSQGEIEPRKG